MTDIIERLRAERKPVLGTMFIKDKDCQEAADEIEALRARGDLLTEGIENLRKAEDAPSLRDQFAMATLQGLMANSKRWSATSELIANDEKTSEQADAELTVLAFKVADAMMEASKEEKSK